MRVWDKGFNNKRTGKILSTSPKMSLITLRSPTQGTLSTQEDYQTRFYNNYRKVAEEYDKDFLKKHEEDLDTTLIFVGSTGDSDEHVLIRVTGWSVLGRYLRVHHRGRLSTSA